MDSDRWTLLQHLFERARVLAADSRAEFVAAACSGDAALRAELLALLAADTAEAAVEGDPASRALSRAAQQWMDDRRQGLVGQRLGGLAPHGAPGRRRHGCGVPGRAR